MSWLVWVAVVLVAVAGGLYLSLTSGTTQIYVADVDLPAYHQLTQDDLELRAVERRRLPPDAVPESAREGLLGRYTTRAVKQGQPLRTDSCGPQLRTGAIASAIVAMPWTAETSLGGQLARGDQVKVLFSPNEESTPEAHHIVDALVVDLISGSSVVLSVRPAEIALFAAQRGSSTVSIVRVGAYHGS
ncbi:SAF domain-containing protein [Kribbella sp. NPDC049584]|uniref:SAF domain-containing protein n=1 Tax=Kribbella sp. NPDC049584 TaxID=3154833 RepID=UPI0034137000